MFNLTEADFAQCDIEAYRELDSLHIPVCQLRLMTDGSAAAFCGAMASKATLCGYFQLHDGQAALLIRRVRDWQILFLKPVVGDLDDAEIRSVRKGSGVISCYAATEEQLEFVANFLHRGTPCSRIAEALRQADVEALLARLYVAKVWLDPLLKPDEPTPQCDYPTAYPHVLWA